MKISILYRYNNHMMIHVEKTHIVMNYQYIFLDKQLVLTKNFMYYIGNNKILKLRNF